MNTNQEISLDELISGIQNFIFCLDIYKEKINNLNVFPVPDGDTGTNMLLTLKSLNLSDSKNTNIEDFLSILKNSLHHTLFDYYLFFLSLPPLLKSRSC